MSILNAEIDEIGTAKRVRMFLEKDLKTCLEIVNRRPEDLKSPVRELKKHYLGKDGELHGVISGVERSGLTIAQAKPIFSKYGYDLEIVISK